MYHVVCMNVLMAVAKLDALAEWKDALGMGVRTTTASLVCMMLHVNMHERSHVYVRCVATDTDRAHDCFFLIELPPYTSLQQCREKLAQAIGATPPQAAATVTRS